MPAGISWRSSGERSVSAKIRTSMRAGYGASASPVLSTRPATVSVASVTVLAAVGLTGATTVPAVWPVPRTVSATRLATWREAGGAAGAVAAGVTEVEGADAPGAGDEAGEGVAAAGACGGGARRAARRGGARPAAARSRPRGADVPGGRAAPP